MIEDNPNPIANIGFLCYYPFHYFVYKNIYRHLPNAEFIVDDSYRVKGYEFPTHTKERLFLFFAKQNVFWRKLEENDTALTRPEFFDKYGLIVNAFFNKEMTEPYIENKKLVRALYGNAKDPWNFGPWNAYYDLVLSYGPYAHKFLNVYGNSLMVGNPKFDDWSNISKKSTGGKKLKKTVLYTPTWGELSSLDNTAVALNALSKEYSITVKAHHITVLLSPSQLDAYRENPLITVLDDTDDIVPLLADTDIVLSDNSGSIFDAVWANKPVVLINTHDSNLILPGHRSFIYKKDGKNNGVQTSPESLEQQVKQAGTAIGPVINDIIKGSNQLSPESLKGAILQSVVEEKYFEARRKSVRDQVFLNVDGIAGEKAASAIVDLLYRQKPPKNWLAESVDVYIREYFPSMRYNHEDALLIELGRRYRALKTLPRLQRIRRAFEEFFPT